MKNNYILVSRVNPSRSVTFVQYADGSTDVEFRRKGQRGWTEHHDITPSSRARLSILIGTYASYEHTLIFPIIHVYAQFDTEA